MVSRLITLTAVFLSAPTMAAANGLFESAYTKLDLDACRVESVGGEEAQGGIWWCDGYAGTPVRVAEGDLRFLVSFGADAANEPAAVQTLGAFNRIGTTLEWRLEKSRETLAPTPVATILRYFTQRESGEPEGQVLVVTRLGPPGQVCHIGYVDAILNADANVIARQVAEQSAAGFDCGRDQPGNFGLHAN